MPACGWLQRVRLIFAELHCDGAGELSSAKLEEALESQVKGPKPRLEGVDPMRVKSHARMEAAVKDVELGVKRMMPVSYTHLTLPTKA